MDYLDCELYLPNFDQAKLSVAGADYSGRPALGGEELERELLEASPDPTRYGILLFEALFDADDTLRAGYRGALAIARREEKCLRFRLHVDALAPPPLHDWHWELLYDPSEKTAFGRSEHIAFSRYLSVPRSSVPAVATQPKVLIVISSPRDLAGYRLPDLDRERTRTVLEEALTPLMGKSSFDFLEGPATAARIGERLAARRYHVLHLQAHGLLAPDGSAAHLVLEDENRCANILDENLLADMLGERRLRLVTLLACYGGVRTGTDPFGGLAAALVRQGIPAVVAMRRAIAMDAAARFARHFYQVLAREGVVDMAANEARHQLYLSDPDGPDWATPALFMRAKDGRLWTPKAAEPARPERAVDLSGRQVPELLPFMANRWVQEDKLYEALQRQAQKPTRPLVCLAIGDDHQALDMFEKRLKEVCLPRLLALDPATGVTDHLLRCPPKLESARKLQARLRRDLSEKFLNAPEGPKEEINRALVGIHRPVLIHVHLLAEECKRGPALVGSFLDFWRDWPDLSPGQKLIVVLFIKYEYGSRFGKGPRSLFSWFGTKRRLKAIRQVFEQYESANPERLTCTILPEMEGITQSDAETWALEEETRQFCRSHPLICEIRTFFQEWKSTMSSDTIPMEDLAGMLEQTLRRYVPMDGRT